MSGGATGHSMPDDRAAGLPPWLGPAALALLVLVVYWPTLGAGVTNWDDDGYVTGNPLFGLPLGDAVQVAFTSYWKGNYHPLAMLSLSFDHAVSGGRIGFHHLVSVSLHAVNTGLVALLAARLLGRRDLAWVVAALFALHPMHVESVAWISARKDLVTTLFQLLSLITWLRYTRASDRTHGAVLYTTSLGLFALALLSKGTAVALAPTLLALDALLGRGALSARRLLEKAPFFALALVFGLVALDAQGGEGQLQGVSMWTPIERGGLAAYAYLRYVWLLAWPHPLSAFYPYPDAVAGALPARFYLAFVGLIGVAALYWQSLRRWPVVAFGIAFYSIHIAFLVQLVPVGGAIIADRYTYLSALGLFLAGVGSVDAAAHRWPRARGAILGAVAVYVALLGVGAFQRTAVWHDSLSLWNDTLAAYPDIPEARLNRALARYEQGDLAGAVEDLGEAVRLSPDYARAWGHRGVIRHQLGQPEAALLDLDQAVRLEPSPDLLTNRGAVRLALGQPREAADDFSRALDQSPGMVLAWANRGVARSELGQHAAAVQDFEIALQLAPGYAPAIYGRALARRAMGQPERALADLDALRNAAPDDPSVLLARGETLLDVGRQTEACSELAAAHRLGAAEAQPLLSRHCGE